jgi:hypothetical protein
MKDSDTENILTSFTFYIFRCIIAIPLIFLFSFLLKIGWEGSVRYIFPVFIEKGYISANISYLTSLSFMTLLFTIIIFIEFLRLKDR